MTTASSAAKRPAIGLAFFMLLYAHLVLASSKISGTLQDPNGAIYTAPAEVTVRSSSGYSKSLVANLKGRFELQVEPGTYWITATAPHCYPYRRAPLVIRDGEQLNLAIVPRIRVLSIALYADGSDRATLAPKPKYEEIHLPGLPDWALVEFTGKKKVDSKGNVRYGDAVLTYSVWSVQSDVLEIRKATKEIVLSKWFRITKGEVRTAEGKARQISLAELEN
jgi:hypothetical protein